MLNTRSAELCGYSTFYLVLVYDLLEKLKSELEEITDNWKALKELSNDASQVSVDGSADLLDAVDDYLGCTLLVEFET